MNQETSSAVRFSEPSKSWSESAIGRRAQVFSSVVLALLILGLGVWTAFSTARTVQLTHSPVIFWDQWAIVRDLKASNGVVSLRLLWSQHSEHRIPIGRLALIADLRYFGGRNVSLLTEIYLVQLGLVLLFAWMCRRFGRFRGVILLTTVGFLSFCMFYPIQIENFYWGFQITYVFAGLAAAICFACMVCHAAKVAAGNAGWISWLLVLAFIAAFLAECSLADGLLVWPIVIALCFWLRLPKQTKVLSAAVGLIAVGTYFIGYLSPPQHADPASTILHPLSMAKYITTYFASTWDPSLPSYSLWPAVSESMTLLAIAFVLGTAIWSFVSRAAAPDLFRSFLIANLLFTLLAAVLTSLGRINFGLAQATSSRYQSIALVFWASLAALILDSISGCRSRGFALVGVQISLIVLMAASAGRFDVFERAAKQHQMSLARAYSALAYDPPNLEALKPVSSSPDLPAWYAYLRAHGIGPDPREFLGAGSHFVKSVPNWAGYHVVAKSNCSGYLDAVNRITPERVIAEGWAWEPAANRAPNKVIFVVPGGLVVGVAEVGLARADVKAVMNLPDSYTGWSGEALAPHGSQLTAFAVLADSKSICPLANEFKLP